MIAFLQKFFHGLASLAMGATVLFLWEVSKGWAVIAGFCFLAIRLWEHMWS